MVNQIAKLVKIKKLKEKILEKHKTRDKRSVDFKLNSPVSIVKRKVISPQMRKTSAQLAEDFSPAFKRRNSI